jgi:hypothetical protein
MQVSDVQIVGTQPWPIGRYGSCELMIGCIARASSYEVLLNPAEMEDVQWYDRAELRAAIGVYERPGPLPELQKRSWSSLGFFVPPPFAVAHHLIAAWASRDEPWCVLVWRVGKHRWLSRVQWGWPRVSLTHRRLPADAYTGSARWTRTAMATC